MKISKSSRSLIPHIGHRFKDPNLLVLALTHRSYGAQNNERLEFLGDAILNFTIGEALYHQFIDASEGELSRLRALLVSGETLAEVALELNVGEHLKLGEGEIRSGGSKRASILADAVEAIIGAVYLDADMDAAKSCVLDWYRTRLAAISLHSTDKDPKTQLQEWLQARKQPLPAYDLVSTSGEMHCQTFTVSCTVSVLKEPTQASAASRRAAEKKAAAEMLIRLEIKPNG